MIPNLSRRNAAIVAAVKRRELTLDAIGAMYGVSRERVRQIGARAGAQRGRKELRNAEKAKIVALHKRGMPFTRIAEALGRSDTVVANHVVRVGLYKIGERNAPWSGEEDAVLRAKYGTARGMVRVIAKELGRTRNEVIGRAFRLGLSRKVGT